MKRLNGLNDCRIRLKTKARRGPPAMVRIPGLSWATLSI